MNLSRIVTVSSLFFLPLFVHAQNSLYPQPLTRIPGITDDTTLSNISTYGLAGFFNGIITFTFTVAAIASVVMIVMIGFQYATTEKSGATVTMLRGKITSVAFGVALIASMFIIFRFINPDIIDTLEIFGASGSLITPTSPTTATAEQTRINSAGLIQKKFYGTLSSKEEDLKEAEQYAVEKKGACEGYGGTIDITYTEEGRNGYVVACNVSPKN
ncbi:hypothetical protein A3C87_02890 [Candidatus Kaiserbacteria bacterium RIFCSPHIGHO2_02_FULL_49_34]|uniref:DUF5671 domain-containing protein n=1 Tax=Candidatus Kaiserbacteria bacterium RIFCSPHIGHO2_02_FULL_49_34 TaxID=1798491 RepID=A0A1F6DJS8_9BACT|nr:MAG: hypothetical protein A3C87_02890 [Candidatus Kaiserbacteria bacterium RIFCSPHIGHO2_02_FULL_49_34]